MENKELLTEISQKLNVLIALSIKTMSGNTSFANDNKRNTGVGEIVRYLHAHGLENAEIAKITGAPVTSVRTLLTPTRTKKK